MGNEPDPTLTLRPRAWGAAPASTERADGVLGSLDLPSVVAALERSPAAVLMFAGPELALVLQNARSRAMIGDRSLGAPGRRALPEYPGYMAAVEQVWRTGRPLALDRAATTVARPGEGAPDVVLLETVLSPLRREDGGLAAVLCQSVDVTGPGNPDERLQVSMAFNRVTVELSRSLEVDQVAATVTRLAAEVFAGWGILDLWQPDGSLARVAATHHDPAMQPLLERLMHFPRVSGRASGESEPHAMRAARTGELVMREVDPQATVAACTDPEHAALMRALNPRWSMSVPVGVGQRRLGALTVVRTGTEARFRPSDRVVLEHFAERAAMALGNARDYDEQRSAALTLQRSLLPSSPADFGPGVQIAVRYAPGGDGAEVGGDWYDTVALSEGALALVVGDVEGHDLHAAALMGQVRAVVHSHAHLGLPPGRIAQEANAFVLGLHNEQLVTMTYVQLYPRERLMVMVRAGHMPVVVVSPDGTWQALKGRGGLPLGVQAGAHWLEETLQLVPGALLAIFSDGLVETTRQDFEDGVKTLASVLAAHTTEDLEPLADRVLARMPGDSRNHDDVALVLVRLRGQLPEEAHSIVRRLPAMSSSAPVARLFLSDVLRNWGMPDDVVATAALLTTELVSNAARESDTAIELRAQLGGSKLKVAVSDDSDRAPRAGPLPPDSTSGRGLQLVEALSSAWGVQTEAMGKAVWFELALK